MNNHGSTKLNNCHNGISSTDNKQQQKQHEEAWETATGATAMEFDALVAILVPFLTYSNPNAYAAGI